MELAVEETHESLANPELTALRFYSVDEGNKTLVRSLSVGPARKSARTDSTSPDTAWRKVDETRRNID